LEDVVVVFMVLLPFWFDHPEPTAQGKQRHPFSKFQHPSGHPPAPPLDGSYPVKNLGEISTRLREDANVGGDAAWYSVDVFDGGLLLVEAIAQGQGDPVLTMYDDLGRQVAHNDDHGGSLDSMITTRIQPGTYLIAVRQLDNSLQGVIRLVFERYVPARPE
ncbi:DVUA0089 family protein, partial [Salibaculum griseiflavum]|uniref:DVUA0089 family protein n=1 Tax=Salibaculum griseiflavum TaxID=1914409 RepID=UPI001C380400